MKKQIRLNIGCGETKLKGFINIDVEKKVKPDLVFNIKKYRLPFKDGSITQINCIHNIEHIEFKFWDYILNEFYRVLKLNGRLILAYPEFERVAENFIKNANGMKDFWRATLYGRQLYRGDYHVTPVVTKDLIQQLFKIGFDEIKHSPEADEPYNTFLMAKKRKILTKEQVYKKEIFGK